MIRSLIVLAIAAKASTAVAGEDRAAPDMMKANRLKRLGIAKRNPEKLVKKDNRGVTRIFHR
ncbi:MAG: hypothetical protein K2W91_08380 [Novosphingobium sp.]|nr:hypothetical protein [Novosphingobium sp.]